jgi:hypothetical protein
MKRSSLASIGVLLSVAGCACAQSPPQWNVCVPNPPPVGCGGPTPVTGSSTVNFADLTVQWLFISGADPSTFAALGRTRATYMRSATCSDPSVSMDSGRTSSRATLASSTDPCDSQDVQDGLLVSSEARAPDFNVASQLACGIPATDPVATAIFEVQSNGSGMARLAQLDSSSTLTNTFPLSECGSVQGSASDAGRAGLNGAFRMTIPSEGTGSSLYFNFSADSDVRRTMIAVPNCSREGVPQPEPIGVRLRIEARLNGAIVRSFIAESAGSVMTFSDAFSSEPGQLTFFNSGARLASVELLTSPGVWTIRVYSLPDVGTAGSLATCFDGDNDPTNDVVNVADITNTDGDIFGLPDGYVDQGDYTAFFGAFFAPEDSVCRWVADVANTDGEDGPDGSVDNGDFVAFFDSYFTGCP